MIPSQLWKTVNKVEIVREVFTSTFVDPEHQNCSCSLWVCDLAVGWQVQFEQKVILCRFTWALCCSKFRTPNKRTLWPLAIFCSGLFLRPPFYIEDSDSHDLSRALFSQHKSEMQKTCGKMGRKSILRIVGFSMSLLNVCLICLIIFAYVCILQLLTTSCCLPSEKLWLQVTRWRHQRSAKRCPALFLLTCFGLPFTTCSDWWF